MQATNGRRPKDYLSSQILRYAALNTRKDCPINPKRKTNCTTCASPAGSGREYSVLLCDFDLGEFSFDLLLEGFW